MVHYSPSSRHGRRSLYISEGKVQVNKYKFILVDIQGENNAPSKQREGENDWGGLWTIKLYIILLTKVWRSWGDGTMMSGWDMAKARHIMTRCWAHCWLGRWCHGYMPNGGECEANAQGARWWLGPSDERSPTCVCSHVSGTGGAHHRPADRVSIYFLIRNSFNWLL